MRFYTYEKETVSYKKFRILRPKFLLILFLFQIILSFGFISIISKVYNTPKEKELKSEISYLVNEFHLLNKRIAESEIILERIRQNDSIIYKSIFESEDIDRKDFEVYWDSEGPNKYKNIVERTNQRLSELNLRLDKEMYSLNSLVKKAELNQDMLKHIPAIQPIDNKDLKRTASGWGWRIHPIYNIRKFHYGLDFTAPTGTEIYSTGDGIIMRAIPAISRESQGYGNVIIIDHGYGYVTLYAHLSEFNVKEGQEVRRGEIIGFVGSTGLSTGPHLHYEVRKDGEKVNPIYYLFNDLTPEEYHKIVEISNSIQKAYD